MLLSSHRLRFYNVLSGSYVASRAQDVISCTPDRGEREKKNMNNKRIFKALAANRVLPPECEHTIFCNYRGSKGKRPIRTPPGPPFPLSPLTPCPHIPHRPPRDRSPSRGRNSSVITGRRGDRACTHTCGARERARLKAGAAASERPQGRSDVQAAINIRRRRTSGETFAPREIC